MVVILAVGREHQTSRAKRQEQAGECLLPMEQGMGSMGTIDHPTAVELPTAAWSVVVTS